MKPHMKKTLGIFCLAVILAVGYWLHTQGQEINEFYNAARQGDAARQTTLGVYYYRGDPFPRDYSKAMQWWRRAANQGYAEAEFYVGRMYWFGESVPRNPVDAYMWMTLAAAQSDPKASAIIPELEKSMTPNQIAEGKRLASQWKPTPEIKPVSGPQ